MAIAHGVGRILQRTVLRTVVELAIIELLAAQERDDERQDVAAAVVLQELLEWLRRLGGRSVDELRGAARRLRERLGGSRQAPPELEAAIAAMRFEVTRQFGKRTVTPVLQVAAHVSRLNAVQANRVLKSIGLDPFDGDAPLRAARDAFVRENTALIRRIPMDMADRIGRRVTEGVSDGKRWETIARELQAEEGIAERRARLIARDQVSKFNGRLNEVRQTEAGVTHYRWQGAMDARERPSHVALQGRIFAWDKPGPEGHPGQAINCRCTAIPVVSARDIAQAEDITPEQLQREVAALGPTIRGSGRRK